MFGVINGLWALWITLQFLRFLPMSCWLMGMPWLLFLHLLFGDCLDACEHVNMFVWTCELISVWMLFQQGAQTLFSMEKLKNVSFEEEYTKLFPPQPSQPLVWLCPVFSPCCLNPPPLFKGCSGFFWTAFTSYSKRTGQQFVAEVDGWMRAHTLPSCSFTTKPGALKQVQSHLKQPGHHLFSSLTWRFEEGLVLRLYAVVVLIFKVTLTKIETFYKGF